MICVDKVETTRVGASVEQEDLYGWIGGESGDAVGVVNGREAYSVASEGCSEDSQEVLVPES